MITKLNIKMIFSSIKARSLLMYVFRLVPFIIKVINYRVFPQRKTYHTSFPTEVGTISPGRQDFCAKISDNAPPGEDLILIPTLGVSTPVAPIRDPEKTSRVSYLGAPFRNQG